MSGSGQWPGSSPSVATPVVRIELKRADALSLIKGDAVLSSCPMVAALGANADAVLRAGTAVRIAAKAPMFSQGYPGHSVFLVLRGTVRLAARNESSDDSFDLGEVHAGQFVGEAEVLEGGAMRAFSAIADTPVDALELPRVTLTSAQGALAPELRALFEQARAQRQASMNDMNDFLNRW